MAQRLDPNVVRAFIIENVSGHPGEIARLVAEHFAVSRQTAHAHLKRMVNAGELAAVGKARHRRYDLVIKESYRDFDLVRERDEDVAWREFVGPLLDGLPSEVDKICHHGFTEMFNNAYDHSEGSTAEVAVKRSPAKVEIAIHDDGVGIFEKIRSRFNLEDHRHAILELSKGKLTTDPKNHSGEGIYFTSRFFDSYRILSSHLSFSHVTEGEDWLIESREDPHSGTTVFMEISTTSTRSVQQVYDRHIRDTDENEFAFTRTHVPLRLAIYGNDGLVSRSQAKRVLARFERFREVLLDFTGIETIGQGFADEIFRVFKNAHPDVNILYVNVNENIRRMIRHVTAPGGAMPFSDAPNSMSNPQD